MNLLEQLAALEGDSWKNFSIDQISSILINRNSIPELIGKIFLECIYSRYEYQAANYHQYHWSWYPFSIINYCCGHKNIPKEALVYALFRPNFDKDSRLLTFKIARTLENNLNSQNE